MKMEYPSLEINIRYSQETGFFYASLSIEGELKEEKSSDSGAEICIIADSFLGILHQEEFERSIVVFEALQD
jgi:hypothetical protein